MDPQDIASIRNMPEGEWRIYITNLIEKGIASSSSLSSIHERINALPCTQHAGDINNLQKWQGECAEEKKLDKAGHISRNTSLLAASISAGISGFFMLLKWFFHVG